MTLPTLLLYRWDPGGGGGGGVGEGPGGHGVEVGVGWQVAAQVAWERGWGSRWAGVQEGVQVGMAVQVWSGGGRGATAAAGQPCSAVLFAVLLFKSGSASGSPAIRYNWTATANAELCYS